MEHSSIVSSLKSVTPTMQPPRASLLGLPQELKNHVVFQLQGPLSRQYLATGQDSYVPISHDERRSAKRDLLSLAYTCHSLMATCTPFIYKDIVLISGIQDTMEAPPCRKPCCQPASKLLYSLTSSPNLGRYITTLIHRRLDPADECIERIFQYTECLTHLYLHYEIHDKRLYRLRIDTHRLATALVPISGTLTVLSVIYDFNTNGFQPYTPNFDDKHEACDLRHLTALKTLTISKSVLLGTLKDSPGLAALLPHSLVRLNLASDIDWIKSEEWGLMREMLRDFTQAAQWRKHTPDLEIIAFHAEAWMRYISEREIMDQEKDMKQFMQKNGLQYQPEIQGCKRRGPHAEWRMEPIRI